MWESVTGQSWRQHNDKEAYPYLSVVFEDVSSGSKVWNDLLTVWAPCRRERENAAHEGEAAEPGAPLHPTDCEGSSDSHHLHTPMSGSMHQPCPSNHHPVYLLLA